MTEWMDETPYPGPHEAESISDFIQRASLRVNGSTGNPLTGASAHFEMRPDGTLVNTSPVTISQSQLHEMDVNLRLKLETSVGMHWYNPADMSYRIDPV